jgi:hypothetical protein
MKRTIATTSLILALGGTAMADLYYVGDETVESLPIRWSVGMNLIYDDNVMPGLSTPEEDSLAVNPYVGVTWINATPQTTLDVYARLGMIYYFDAPNGVDDFNPQSRLGVNLTHRFSERLRFISRNFVSYELEPDYSYGYANTRVAGEYFYWQSYNAIGFRWTERFGTYTGITFSGVDYTDSSDNDRLTIGFNNEFRYQLTPQTVLTAEYRYNETMGNGLGRDSTNHFGFIGAEHRFSPTTVGVLRLGMQQREVDLGSSNTEPSLEAALSSRLNDQFSVRAFVRYSMESYDTVRIAKGSGQTVEYDQRGTLRVGVSAEYILSPTISFNGGIDYIPASYENGVRRDSLGGPDNFPSSADDEIFNVYVGMSYKFTDYLFGTLSYTYTDSSSDLAGRDYERNRVSVGVRAEF